MKNSAPIRVFLVEDSLVALTILKRILASSPEVDVVGTAPNGVEALERIPAAQPQVICTDLHMPKMDGLELTHRIMRDYPRPILVISASVNTQEDSRNVFKLLQAGALDVFPKPNIDSLSDYEQVKHELINRIKVLAGVTVFTRHTSRATVEPRTHPLSPKKKPEPFSPKPVSNSQFPIRNSPFSLPKVVAIGASTGGPQALYAILKQLPANFPVPILCVQHISEGFLQGLVDWLAAECFLRVTIAQPGEFPKPGTVYFAPERQHLQLDTQGRLTTVSTPAVSGHRPSVTALFQAVATCYPRSAVGILLTGMGRDGADGLQAIAQAGGTTIAQDEQTCVVFGMPKEAIALGAAQHILAIGEIAPMLLNRISSYSNRQEH
ncbi:MAG: chemotaxis-specific protein-glutamate methyltransferase CheB [Nostoc sp. DedSLP03]|uniref:chemotaxis-specific protein-glutamate methyltransferase CheB n=1 Tax=Nostoc sp. DedSLP03 TaxID=3075400 RepID=UPI002AD3510A|nr:chemotaxis-specific protein-glutamate methyltransferase CheB [Nostoc sp. DedSLP03]MDZ7968775.1 chemotaxis-specific protein-glutamate methyltransferase CheB [Nostoc sp. DedSLP03]